MGCDIHLAPLKANYDPFGHVEIKPCRTTGFGIYQKSQQGPVLVHGPFPTHAQAMEALADQMQASLLDTGPELED